ncbi:hypothetical protein GH714_011791 [Hevea brasiliensis]|uniref:Uncharacterized protein n=1 Tax=Hevea brasiliensis TaxID=3981 RepID=A0A6A6LL23_HEVBR|nr:hypothetical protein GH714_011791 [Hevea brasiliensis]
MAVPVIKFEEKSDDIQFKIPAENEGSPTIRQQATPPNTPSPFSSTSPSTTSSSSSNSSASEAFVSSSEPSDVPFTTRASRARDQFKDVIGSIKRRDVLGLVFGLSSMLAHSSDAKGAGLPPEEKPRLWDDVCKKELENVW